MQLESSEELLVGNISGSHEKQASRLVVKEMRIEKVGVFGNDNGLFLIR